VPSNPAMVDALLLSSLAATAARAEGERIAVFTKNGENPNYRAFLLGSDRAAAALGAITVHRIPRKPDDPVEQTALLEAQLDERPDAILFNPADDKGLVAPLTRITDAGIPVVGFVNRMSGGFVSFVGADDRALGYAAAKYLLAALDGRGSVVIIEGSAGATTARDRMIGFQRALAEAPGVTPLGSASGNYLKRGGLEAMTGLLETHRAIDGASPPMTAWRWARSRRWPRPTARRASSAATAPSKQRRRSPPATCWRRSITTASPWAVSRPSRRSGICAAGRCRRRLCCRPK
jgi:ABC-type sugar transport system substrate-binding protein